MATRSPFRTAFRWTARVGATVLVLLVVGGATAYGVSERRLRARFAVPDHSVVVQEDSATVAAGRHIATIRGCVDCHGPDLGGRIVVDDPAIGLLAATNLTGGGQGAVLTEADWERAVRHGVRRDSSPLLMMPAHEYSVLSDEDLGAIVAYARSLPAIGTAQPGAKPGPLGRALHLAGQFPLLPAEKVDHAAPHPARVAVEPTAAYGGYLASSCIGCHGETLAGGKIPGAPPEWGPAANITPAGIGNWTEADLARALRTGRRPDGSTMDTTVMPVRLLKTMTDVEVTALYAYLKTVPPREFGAR